MLKPIVRAGQNCSLLIPDYLLVVQEADAQQAIQHLARENARVPNVRDLQAGHEREGFRPVGTRVARDARFGMAGVCGA